MAFSLEGQSVLVAGSTRRVGKAVALRLGAAGARVGLSGRDAATGEAAVEEMTTLGYESAFFQVDLTDYSQVKAMVDRAIERFGRIDVLVASAAGRTANEPTWKPFHEVPVEDYFGYAVTQWFSKAYSIRAVLDHMIEHGGGKIVVIATDAGRFPTVGESMVGGGSAASIQMAKVLSKEFQRWKIRINVIAVSLVDTPDSPIFHPPAGEEPPQFVAAMRERLLGRQKFLVTGDEVGDAVLFLASPAGDAITGQVFSVNGGISVA
jgi:2-hydroxycyclohexanecarboxyl-CoA dehydrogenase